MAEADPHRSISLLAVDIDGTLVADGDRVSDRTRDAMRRAREHLAVVLATGGGTERPGR